MKIPVLISTLIFGNLLVAQFATTSMYVSNNPAIGNQAFNTQAARNDQQIYTQQLNNWAGQKHKKNNRANQRLIQAKIGTCCSVSLTNGMTLTSLKIQAIKGDKLVVTDQKGSTQELYILYVSSIKIESTEQSGKSMWNNLANSLRFKKYKDTNTLQLGWLSLNEKIVAIKSVILQPGFK